MQGVNNLRRTCRKWNSVYNELNGIGHLDQFQHLAMLSEMYARVSYSGGGGMEFSPQPQFSLPVAIRALTWVVFIPRASFTLTLRSGSSPTPTAYSQCNMTLYIITRYKTRALTCVLKECRWFGNSQLVTNINCVNFWPPSSAALSLPWK